MLNIVLALLFASIGYYAGSAIGMDSVGAFATGIISGALAGALSLHQKPVAKVAAISAALGACSSVAVQILAGGQGTSVQLEYVLLFAALACLLGVLGCSFWAAVVFAFRRAPH